MGDYQIRFGIIGCAQIARKIARAINLSPNSTLYAIGSRSIEKAHQFASTVKAPDSVKIYGSYDQVLDDPCVDAVYMPVPTSLHVIWAISAVKKKKHLLLEKPTALDVVELDRILEACESNGVQFMDGSMWLHHPRTTKIKEMLLDSGMMGDIQHIYTTSTLPASDNFLKNNIRVKQDMDSLGALGDIGWYCIGAILWAKNYQLPTSIVALPNVSKNSSNIILSCSASLEFNDHDNKKTTTIFHCSFLSYSSMDLTIIGSNGLVHMRDFIIPFEEDCAFFDFKLNAKLGEMDTKWDVLEGGKNVVDCEMPQEALMIQEFAKNVEGIAKGECQIDKKWFEISRKTQLVIDAIKKSIDLSIPIYL